MSPRTLRVIRARCQGGAHCHVPVDSTIFGDPCPGTYKYIEVHYSCDKGNNKQDRTFIRLILEPAGPPRFATLATHPCIYILFNIHCEEWL